MHTLLHRGQRRSRRSASCARWPTGAIRVVLRDDRARRRRRATPRTWRRPRCATAASGSSTGASGASPAPIGAAFAIVVAKTGDDEAAGHRNYSLILVPTDTPGWEVERDPEWMGSHSPGGHPIIAAQRRARARSANLLGGEGEGFVIAQKRLAGGRLAHAMRWIGDGAARAGPDAPRGCCSARPSASTSRATRCSRRCSPTAAIDLYASRLMVLHTAWKLEHGLPHRQEVAMTKTFVSEAFGRIADRAVQIHGAAGIALDLPVGADLPGRARRAHLRRRLARCTG